MRYLKIGATIGDLLMALGGVIGLVYANGPLSISVRVVCGLLIIHNIHSIYKRYK